MRVPTNGLVRSISAPGLDFPLAFTNRTYRATNVRLNWPGTYVGQVRVTDDEGGIGSRATTIAVQHINSRPVLDIAPTPTFTTVVAGNTNHLGNTVASLLSGRVTDANAGSQRGLALVTANNTGGIWQYSQDGGKTWTDVGQVSGSSALLLPDSARLRFLAQLGFVGSAGIQYRAWDRSAGVAGSRVDLTRTGALLTNSPASDAVETARVSVVAPPAAMRLQGEASDTLANVTVPIGTALSLSLGNLEESADRLSYRLSLIGSETLPGWIQLSEADDIIVIAPERAQIGNHVLQVAILDPSGSTSVKTMNIAVPASQAPWTNSNNRLDVDGNQVVTAKDALLVINNLNTRQFTQVDARETMPSYLDVNGDMSLTAIDALLVINALNRGTAKWFA